MFLMMMIENHKKILSNTYCVAFCYKKTT